MNRNAKENLNLALKELCNCENHLNTAYLNSEESYNRTEIHEALKAVSSAVDAAQDAIRKYKD
ncbi:MAG: hypothetical protein HUJ77_14605 [Clostridium sp.]|uniref:hypothetical protein n=1 Tax=Clostridium sp. TaxID=1506 RepID=UPI0025BB790D|nr:hypothetical protein [Clostridium sp.]MCF0149612.1 hypothetical protein [Clostridium sp.]